MFSIFWLWLWKINTRHESTNVGYLDTNLHNWIKILFHFELKCLKMGVKHISLWIMNEHVFMSSWLEPRHLPVCTTNDKTSFNRCRVTKIVSFDIRASNSKATALLLLSLLLLSYWPICSSQIIEIISVNLKHCDFQPALWSIWKAPFVTSMSSYSIYNLVPFCIQPHPFQTGWWLSKKRVKTMPKPIWHAKPQPRIHPIGQTRNLIKEKDFLN